VTDQQVPWSVEAPQYQPTEFVAPHVRANSSDAKPDGWADPDKPHQAEIQRRGSHELQRLNMPWMFDPKTKRPLNPRGRTGMTNRGALGKWGANHAADPIVTRYNLLRPGRPLEMVAIKRHDTGEWAIPGGMVDPGELVSQTLKREFTEEAGNVPAADRARFEELAAELFSPCNARAVFQGCARAPQRRTPREGPARAAHARAGMWTTRGTRTMRGWRRSPCTSTARASWGSCSTCARATTRRRCSGSR
jgi:ADP-ribose pyrophosphatase